MKHSLVKTFSLLLFSATFCGAMEVTTSQVMKFGGAGDLNEQFSVPYGLAVNPQNGEIWVSDTGHQLIKRFAGTSVYIDSFGGSGSAQGYFHSPHAVAISPSGNDLYVLDTGNHRVQQFDISTNAVSFVRLWGAKGHENEELYYPRDIEVGADGNVYVLDSGNGCVKSFTSNGVYIATLGSDAGFRNPYGLCVDADSHVFVADMENSRIVKLNPNGSVAWAIGGKGSGAGEFRYPRDVAADSHGNIYVADTDNRRIQMLDPTGRYVRRFGWMGEFIRVQSLEMIDDDRLWTIDSTTHRIQVYEVGQIISEAVALNDSFSPDGDGENDTVQFRYNLAEPSEVSVNVYNSSGDLIATLQDSVYSAMQINSVSWDGMDSNGDPVPAGRYEIRISAYNPLTGKTTTISLYVDVVYPSEDPQIDVSPRRLNFSHTL